MAYLDYVGLAYFKSLLDENYLRTDYSGDTTIQGNVTFTEPVDADVKNDYLGNQIDKTYIKNLRPEDDGEVALIYGDNHEEVITIDTAVTQVRSDANEMYPILLCYDANAEVNQISKSVRYGHNVAINPAYGYVYANSYVVKHPTYNRTVSPTVRVEWANDFRDSVLNPVGQVFEYIDPVSSGGEHRMEFRLYGNPNVAGINTPNVNDETNTISMGVSATRGDSLTFFGYCPSTPIYLENGSTMRKSLTRGDQYGRDIITRDWLDLNGSITGLVHTYMDETIDGAKTFKKTVTINSGDNNNKAGLYVQGNSDVHGNEHVYGTETVDGKLTANNTAEIKGGSGNTPSLTVTGNERVTGNEVVDGNGTVGGTFTTTGKLTANGTAEIKGGSENNPSLTVTGDEKITGNSSITGNETVGGNISTTNGNISTTNGTVSGKTGSIGTGGLTVAGSETVTGKITGNGGAEISGGSGLKVNGNETVTGNITTNGTITKIVNNTPVEYVTYVTNQPATREVISQNLLALGKGLAKDSQGKIYVDFSQIDDNTKATILAGLDIQVPLKSNITLYVNPGVDNDTDSFNLSYSERVVTPFTTINKAVEWASSKLALGTKNVTISVYAGTYEEAIVLPEVNTSTGSIIITTQSGNKDVIIQPPYYDFGMPRSGIVAGSGACRWTLKHLTVNLRLKSSTSNAVGVTSCIAASANGAVVTLIGCTVKALPVESTVTGYNYNVRMITASMGGTIYLYPDDLGSELIFNLPTTNTADIHIIAIDVNRNGTLIRRYDSSSNNGNYYCQGTCNTVYNAWASGNMQEVGGTGAEPVFVVASGKSVVCDHTYILSTGSYAILPTGGFPGNGTSSVDSSTYCWVTGG